MRGAMRVWMPLLADGSIFRDPAGWGYPDLPAGTVREPKFGYIFVENRDPTKRRTKLVVRSSHASASNPALVASHFERTRLSPNLPAPPRSHATRAALSRHSSPPVAALTPHHPQLRAPPRTHAIHQPAPPRS